MSLLHCMLVGGKWLSCTDRCLSVVFVRIPCLLFVGSEKQSTNSGPYKFKPLPLQPLDYSVTSAYQPSTAPLSITELPHSPLHLQRATSHKSPTRPSFPPDQSSSRPRTYSSSSYAGSNGRRPVPAPRLSISSRADADYAAVDMTDRAGNSWNNSPEHSLLYSERVAPTQTNTTTTNLSLSKASTLPGSALRSNLESHQTKSNGDKGKGGRRLSVSSATATDAGHQRDSESAGILPTDSHENKSRSSKRGKSSQQVKRINSRTSLTDLEKSERRKSDLLESSPYPHLYSLALDDDQSAASSGSSPSHATNRAVADPLYTQIKKARNSDTHSKLNGNKQLLTNALSNLHITNTSEEELTNKPPYGGDSDVIIMDEDSNTPLHAGGPSSPIYERIDNISPSPRFPLSQWQLPGT